MSGHALNATVVTANPDRERVVVTFSKSKTALFELRFAEKCRFFIHNAAGTKAADKHGVLQQMHPDAELELEGVSHMEGDASDLDDTSPSDIQITGGCWFEATSITLCTR